METLYMMTTDRKTSIVVLLACALLSQASYSQTKPSSRNIVQKEKTVAAPTPVNKYAAVDQKALQIPDSYTKNIDGIATYISNNFSSSKDKARASYVWIASNIQYDLENMFAINFYEKKQDRIEKALKTRKGICSNYAALFNVLCQKLGIKSFVVEGYTKQNGFADYIPHAWCAAYIDTAWFLFDPTWGSGYVLNARFYNKLNNFYFMASPAELIKSHMPFDYLWQFLYYPVSNQEFYEGNSAQNSTKPFFNYPDSIAAYEQLSEMDYYKAAVLRIEKNGVKNAMIFDRSRQLRQEIENDRQNRIINDYNASVNEHNLSVRSYNIFIEYRNKQFKPMKSDPEIQAMLDSASGQLNAAKKILNQIKNAHANTVIQVDNFRKQIADLDAQIAEQQHWLKQYFSKGKSGRKSMFTTYTIFGIPVK
jgi:Transglutaminase-like superfamily